MAGAYAALVSLINTIAMEKTARPSHPPIPFDGPLIDALLQRVEFLVEFLEQGCKGAEHLEGRIADLAFAAEDAIESPIVDQILGRPTSRFKKKRSLLSGRQDPKTILREMDSIVVEMRHIKDKCRMKTLPLGGPNYGGSSSAPLGGKAKMVGLEDEMIQLLEDLERKQSTRQVISIVGMGGIGKTTLARNLYANERVVQYFDVRAWVTISQEYNLKKILMDLLSSLKRFANEEVDVHILGEAIYRSLSGWRYLVILDDVWDIGAWDDIKRFLPNNNSESRIMVTTRLSNLAKELSTRSPHQMKYLDDDNSWKLLCQNIFDKGSCPTVLETVGKRIAKCCKGLPLGIGVIGGLLSKSITLEYWEQVANDFNSSIYLNDEENCLNVLSLSYNHLPISLKPCFLYIAVFPEEREIDVSKLTKLWVAEGFLKPIIGKTFEEIADQYLNDLIERNLIMVHEWTRFSRRVKSCTIHDLLRELCLREAKKENLLYVVTQNSLRIPQNLKFPRCIVILKTESEWSEFPEDINSLQLMSYPRSLIVNYEDILATVLGSPIFWLLRVLFVMNNYHDSREVGHLVRGLPNLVNLRYIDFTNWNGVFDRIFSLHMGQFRNLQMLVLKNSNVGTPCQIWNLLHLRHIEFGECPLSEPLLSYQQGEHCIVLENLKELIGLLDFRFGEEVLKRIPNVQKLKVVYDAKAYQNWLEYNAKSLASLTKLESLSCSFALPLNRNTELCQNLAFPHSLKQLSLCGCKLLWEDMTVIGSLPNLEVFKLINEAFVGSTWNPIEGEFLRLKSLCMFWITDLVNWNADKTHFPNLEQLFLLQLTELKELPEEIGEIPTLKMIKLIHCPDSLVISAKKILVEQQGLGNDELVVKVRSLGRKRILLEGLGGKNFHLDSTTTDNWERLVDAALRRDELRELAMASSFSSRSYSGGWSSPEIEVTHVEPENTAVRGRSTTSKIRRFLHRFLLCH